MLISLLKRLIPPYIRQKLINLPLSLLSVHPRSRLYYSDLSRANTFALDTPAAEIPAVPEMPFYIDRHLLVLSESWFKERGFFLGWGALVTAVVIGFTCIFMPFVSPFIVERATTFSDVIFLFSLACAGLVFCYPLLVCAYYELKVMGAKVAAFDRRTQRVHFVSDIDQEPRSCRFDECTFCIAFHIGNSLSGHFYELRAYLFDNAGDIRDSFSIDACHTRIGRGESSNRSMVKDLSQRFEYIRRFMRQGANTLPAITEFVDLKPGFLEAYHRLMGKVDPKDGIVSKVLLRLIAIPLKTFFTHQLIAHCIFCRRCRLPAWPAEVVKECGPGILLRHDHQPAPEPEQQAK